jgi:hypothetical protein
MADDCGCFRDWLQMRSKLLHVMSGGDGAEQEPTAAAGMNAKQQSSECVL